MTIINPNSIAGITSVTAQAGVMNFYKSDGTLAGLQLNGVNFNTTAGVSTFNNVYVGGTITYEDVKNVDSVGIVTAREGIFIPDSKKLQLGNAAGSADLEIFHDGSHSYVKDTGTGDLVLQGTNNVWLQHGNGENALKATQDAGVELRFNNLAKLETTSGGAKVTGQLEVTTGANSFLTSANVFKGTAGQKGVYLRSALSAEGTPSYSSVDDTNTGMFLPGSDVCAFTTGGSERLRITSGGVTQLNIASNGAYTEPLLIRNGGTGAGANVGLAFWNGDMSSTGAGAMARIKAIDVSNHDSDLAFETGLHSGWANTTTERLRITSAGDFGLGISSPTTQSGRVVHLHAGANQQRLHMTNSTTGSGATDGFEIIVEQSANVRIRNFEAGALMFDTGGSNNEAMRIDSSGRVMIGTTSPGFGAYGDALTIYNSNNVGLTLRTATNKDAAIYFADSASGNGRYPGFIDYSNTNNYLRFGSNESERMRIDSSGRVIIGHTANVAAWGVNSNLQVLGTSANASTIVIGRYESNAFSGNLLFTKSRNGTIGSQTIVQDGDEIGTIGFNASDGTDLANASAYIQGRVDGTPGSNNTPGRLGFYTTPSGSGASVERLRIQSDGYVWLNKANPQANSSIVLDKSASGGASLRFYNAGSQLAYIQLDASEDMVYWGGANVDQIFYTAGYERLRINPTGQVLIGSTSASTSDTFLEVKNASSHTEVNIISKNDSGALINLGDTDSYNQGRIKYNNSDNSLSFRTSASDRLNITSGGIIEVLDSVTLSSNAPSVKGKIRISGPSDGTNAGGLEFHTSSGGGGGYGGRITCDANGHMRFHTRANNSGWGDRLLITADGEIRCTGAANNKGFAVYISGSQRVAEIIEHENDGELRLYTGESTPVLRTVLTSYGDSYINAAASGKLLIGTTSSNAPNGSVHIANAFLRLQAGNQNSSNFSQQVGIEWSQESGSDVQVGKIVMRRDSWGGAPHNMDFYTRNYSNSVIRALILHYNQNASLTGSLTQNASDIRLKENIQPITNALEKVNSLSGFTFNWNQKGQDLGFTGEGHDDVQVGLSAQDVEKIQPEVVKPAPIDNDYKTIQYEKLVPLLLESIKELSTQVESLKEEITILKDK